jgi:hypothetical protein
MVGGLGCDRDRRLRREFYDPIHAAVSIWEVALMAMGFKKIEPLSWFASVTLGFAVKAGIYIPLAAIFVR